MPNPYFRKTRIDLSQERSKQFFCDSCFDENMERESTSGKFSSFSLGFFGHSECRFCR